VIVDMKDPTPKKIATQGKDLNDYKITLGVQILPENEVIDVLAELEDNYEQKNFIFCFFVPL